MYVVMDVSDSKLWERSRSGDAGAFGLLFERHASTIYNFCYRRLGDWAVAEDMLSIVFLETWRTRDKELPPGMVLPWIYGVAANVTRYRRRSERRYAAALRRIPASLPEQDFSDTADARLDDERQARDALARLAALPQREQDVFVLCAWSDLTYQEASFALSIPVGTVRSRLARARSRLALLDVASDPPSRSEASSSKEVLDP